MTTHHGANASLLAHIAERVMSDAQFVVHAPQAAVDQANRAPETPQAPAGSRDLRKLAWTSIDNPESRDLDQIEVVEPTARGVRLFVGIADVDAFVAKGSPVDAIAAANTTSVYTGVRTFPMLPDHLSFDATSLIADADRLAIVFETEIGSDGTVLSGTSYPALVRNHAKLDYPSVSVWLDGGALPRALEDKPTLQAQVKAQDALAKTLGEARKRDGALDVDTEETRAVMENGEVVGLAAQKQERAGRIIEELMIATNRAVAHALDAAKVPSIRRVVKAPERWAKIVTYALERGVKLPETPSSVALSEFVDKMRAERPSEMGDISLSIVKLMGRGEYVAHQPGQKEIGHFGLATSEYTHSTAPNRRFCDLVIQRIVKKLGHGQAYSFDELARIATHASEREAAAQKVERRVQKSAAASLLHARIGEKFEGIITGAADKGTFVRTFHPHAEGKVVKGQDGLRVGDRVTVTLKSTDVERGFLDFVIG